MGPCQASKLQKYVQPSMTNDPRSGQLNTVNVWQAKVVVEWGMS